MPNQMIVKEGANERFLEMLIQPTNVGLFKELTSAVNNGYKGQFVRSMSDYIQRVAGIVNKLVDGVYREQATTYSSIRFLSDSVCGNKRLGDQLLACGLNDESNTVKHSNENVNINIDETVGYYNRLINDVMQKTHIDNLNKCLLRKQTQSVRDIPLLNNSDSIKYECFDGFKYSLEISSSYEVDPYTKKVLMHLVFKPQNTLKNYFIWFNELYVNGERLYWNNTQTHYLNDTKQYTINLTVDVDLIEKKRREAVIDFTVRIGHKYNKPKLFNRDNMEYEYYDYSKDLQLKRILA